MTCLSRSAGIAIAVTAALIYVAMMPFPACAQGPVDFNGTWALDAERSSTTGEDAEIQPQADGVLDLAAAKAAAPAWGQRRRA